MHLLEMRKRQAIYQNDDKILNRLFSCPHGFISGNLEVETYMESDFESDPETSVGKDPSKPKERLVNTNYYGHGPS